MHSLDRAILETYLDQRLTVDGLRELVEAGNRLERRVDEQRASSIATAREQLAESEDRLTRLYGVIEATGGDPDEVLRRPIGELREKRARRPPSSLNLRRLRQATASSAC